MSAPPGRAGREGPRVPSPAWRGLGGPAAASGGPFRREPGARRLCGRAGGGRRARAERLPDLQTGLAVPLGQGPHLSIPLIVPGRRSPFLRPQARPPPGASGWAGGGGGDLIAVTRDSSQGQDSSRVPLLVARASEGRAEFQGLGWGGSVPGRRNYFWPPFPWGFTSARLSRKEGPLPTGGRVRPRGLDLCPQSASPKAWDLRAGPGARLRAWGAHSVHACCASQAAAPRLVGEGAGAGWRQGRGWGAGRRREAPSRIALSRNVLCPAPPWLRPKYWPLPWLLLGVTLPPLEAGAWGSQPPGAGAAP